MKTSKIIGTVVKIGAFFGGIAGIAYFGQKSLQKETKLQKRYRAYYELANQWLLNKNRDCSIATYFENNGYKSIAIYGMGTLGEVFYEDVKKAGIEVKYFVDKNADELYYGMDNLPVCGLDDIENQEKVDIMVITPIYDFDDIAEDLADLSIDCEIVSLEDIIYGI